MELGCTEVWRLNTVAPRKEAFPPPAPSMVVPIEFSGIFSPRRKEVSEGKDSKSPVLLVSATGSFGSPKLTPLLGVKGASGLRSNC